VYVSHHVPQQAVYDLLSVIVSTVSHLQMKKEQVFMFNISRTSKEYDVFAKSQWEEFSVEGEFALDSNFTTIIDKQISGGLEFDSMIEFAENYK
jgi:hypothetical protein